MTLRRRILLGLMLLVGVGLVVTDAVLWFGLRTYLYEQVDSQLTAFANSPQAGSACGAQGGGFFDNGGTSAPGLPANSFVAFVSAGGQVMCTGFLDPQAAGNSSPPRLPTHFGSAAGQTPTGRPFGATAVSGGAGYRLLALPATLDHAVAGTLVVGIPTGGARSTLDRLRLIEVLTTLAILVALGVAASTMIRVGLRQLDAMTDTAGAIAAGDLSRRVPPGDPRTEVGRLGAAMNAMLAQIETAFSARARSESQLRRFVADASHELRTPLTSIRGYAELFRRGAATRPEDLATAMRRIEEEATRMSALVDDLLQLARLDVAAAERRQPVREPVDLARIAGDAAGDLLAVEPARPVTLEAAPAATTGDEPALRQVAVNLVANARHHTPAAAPVTVRSGTTPDGAQAFLEVEDGGPGMSEADASHVFERFWRADPARTRGHGGAGLGLSIVAAIVEAHGGRVELDTAPGRGSRFRVELPARPPSLPAGTEAADSDAAGGPAPVAEGEAATPAVPTGSEAAAPHATGGGAPERPISVH